MASSILIKLLGDNAHVEGVLEDTEGRFAAFGGFVTKTLATAGAAGAATIGTSFYETLDREASTDLLAGSLGIDEATAEKIGEEASEAYSQAWGDSFEEVQTALGRINQRGLVENIDDLDKMGEKAFAFAEIIEGDVQTGIERAGFLLEHDMAKSGEAAFDQLTWAMQQISPEIQDELFAATEEYAQYFDSLGQDGDNMFRLLVKAGEGGARDLDKYGDALKELTIRGTDMSQSSVDAFELMGKDAKLYADLLLEGGDGASDALFGIIRGLKAIEDPVEQANAAIALFGAPLEDIGTNDIPLFLDNLQQMGGGMDEIDGTTARLASQLGDNFKTRLVGLRREGFEALVKVSNEHLLPAFLRFESWVRDKMPEIKHVASEVFTGISEAVAVIRDNFEEYWPQIRATIGLVFDWLGTTGWPMLQAIYAKIVEGVQWITAKFLEHWPQIQEIIAEYVGLILAIIERFSLIAKGIWKRWGDEITIFVTKAMKIIGDVIGAALDFYQALIQTFTALFQGEWSDLWQGVQDILAASWELIKEYFKLQLEAFKLIFTVAWQLLKEAVGLLWSAITAVIVDAWNSIKSAAVTKLSELYAVVTGKFNEIIVWIIGLGTRIYNAVSTAFGTVKDAITDSFTSAKDYLVGWIADRLTMIIGWGTSLKDAAFTAFNLVKDGIIEALGPIPQWIEDNILGPIQDVFGVIGSIKDKVGGIIGGIGDFITGGGDSSDVRDDLSNFDGNYTSSNVPDDTSLEANKELLDHIVGLENATPAPIVGTINNYNTSTLSQQIDNASALYGDN